MFRNLTFNLPAIDSSSRITPPLLWAVPYKSDMVGLGYVSAVTDLSMETTIGNGGDVVATGGSFNYVGQGLVFSMAHPVAARLDVGASIT